MTAPTEERTRAVPADTLAVRLMLARHHAGDLTIRDAAEKCGLNYGSWSNWERGTKPRDLVDVADQISEGLGIDRDWLLFGGPLAREARRRRTRDRHGRRGNIPPSWHVTHRAARTSRTDSIPVAVTASEDAATAPSGPPFGPRTARPMWRHA